MAGTFRPWREGLGHGGKVWAMAGRFRPWREGLGHGEKVWSMAGRFGPWREGLGHGGYKTNYITINKLYNSPNTGGKKPL